VDKLWITFFPRDPENTLLGCANKKNEKKFGKFLKRKNRRKVKILSWGNNPVIKSGDQEKFCLSFQNNPVRFSHRYRVVDKEWEK
jgi:hypothetical protein